MVTKGKLLRDKIKGYLYTGLLIAIVIFLLYVLLFIDINKVFGILTR